LKNRGFTKEEIQAKWYSVDEILKLLSIRIEILRAKGTAEADIEADIQKYLVALNHPTPELKRFTDRQMWFGKAFGDYLSKGLASPKEETFWK
jgi:hypothetical protein